MRIVVNKALTITVLLAAASHSALASATLRINATQSGISGAVAVRAIIKKSDGSFVPGEWGNPAWPPITMRGKAMAPGTTVQVPAGVTEITVGKGPDIIPQFIRTNLADGQTYTINVALQPALGLYSRGWRAGDAHVHFIHGENEISRTPADAFAMGAAGGLNFMSLCEEHLGAGSQTRQQMIDTWKAYDNSECKLWIGVEEPKNAWGHHVAILYDPWKIRSALPYHWGIHSVHQQGGVSIPVHPDRLFPGRYYDGSGGRQWFLLPSNNHLKSYPMDALIGHLFDAWSGVSDEGHKAEKLPPYFKLLELGYKIPYVADSDFCFDRANNGEKGLGSWTTYYHTEGQPVTQASIANAIRKGRAIATTGPTVLFSIDNYMSGDTLPPDGSARTVRIDASHTFNPWTLGSQNIAGNDICKVQQIDLYRNGQIIRTWNPNTPTASVTHTINETQGNSYYMVRVLGNSSQWMAAYASPIYFDSFSRPRQPEVFKSLIQGRLYDAANGAAVSGNVSCVRYGQTEWTIPTDSQGRFQAYVPLDAQLVARDGQGRQFTQDILQYEPAFRFCHYLSDDYVGNMAGSIEPFRNIVQNMRWEFPMGHQPSASYVKTTLSGNGPMSNFAITSAPAPTPGKTHTEITRVIMDKTQVQPGDTVNYAIIYRSPTGQVPTELLSAEAKGWDPNRPRMYNKYGTSFHWNEGASTLTYLGGGFSVRTGSFVVPTWAANATETTAAFKLFATVRANGKILEEANLLVPVGPTKRELLVSSTWDGFPAGWGERGIGPCNFFREWTFLLRYADYRTMGMTFNVNGQPITVRPTTDTAHVADADDAAFYEPFYYEGQCEPQYRNIPFRDPVRTQPSPPSFSGVPVHNPADTTAPTVVALEPQNNAQVPGGIVNFHYFIADAGGSGASAATLLIDGNTAVANTYANPISFNVPSGTHTWQIVGVDEAGNRSQSEVRSLVVGNATPDTTRPTVAITAPANNAAVSGSNVVISATASDNIGVVGVQFRVDEANVGSEKTSTPYSLSWNSRSVSDGVHRLSAVARDAAGNRTTSAVVSVTVSNTVVTPTNGANDVIWFDDALPAGAVPGGTGGDSWNWVSSPRFSGTLAHQSTGTGDQQHFFNYATQTLTVRTGQVLIAYVYLDPANPPQQIMLQWNDGSWEHRAYWGASINTYGVEGTRSRRYMGPLPPAGQWVRLEVPARRVGLEGSVLKGMAFTLYGGRATWDYVGKSKPTTARLAIQRLETAVQLTWESSPGDTYRIQCRHGFDDPDWTDVTNVTATDSECTWTDVDGSTGQRFYRVIVVQAAALID